MCQDNTVSKVTVYRLDDQSLIPGKDTNFSLCHHLQTGSEAHPASCQMSAGGSLPKGKVAGE